MGNGTHVRSLSKPIQAIKLLIVSTVFLAVAVGGGLAIAGVIALWFLGQLGK